MSRDKEKELEQLKNLANTGKDLMKGLYDDLFGSVLSSGKGENKESRPAGREDNAGPDLGSFISLLESAQENKTVSNEVNEYMKGNYGKPPAPVRKGVCHPEHRFPL